MDLHLHLPCINYTSKSRSASPLVSVAHMQCLLSITCFGNIQGVTSVFALEAVKAIEHLSPHHQPLAQCKICDTYESSSAAYAKAMVMLFDKGGVVWHSHTAVHRLCEHVTLLSQI